MLKIKKAFDELEIYKHSYFYFMPNFGKCLIVDSHDMTTIISRIYTIEWLWFGIIIHMKLK